MPVSFEIVVLDATMIIGKSAAIYSSLERHSDKFICLLPVDSPFDLCTYVETTCKYIISFPLSIEKFRNTFLFIQNQIYQKIKHNNPALLEYQSIPDNVMGYFCGTSTKIKAVRKKLFDVARVKTPVLLLGETGTGKSKAAELIHQLSDLKSRKLISRSFAEISESLAESAFFGHVKGAFTNAEKESTGFFEQAKDSTLFLDELGKASLYIQAMLLTVLDNGKYTKVGGDKEQHSNARLIFATNADIGRMMHEGTFLLELYFRIYDNTIVFPLLKERKEDIPEMVSSLISKDEYILRDEALEKLMNHDWPGNLREFNKCLAGAMIQAKEHVIREEHIHFGDLSFRQ